MSMLREVTTEFVVRPPPHVPVHHRVALPRHAVVARHLPHLHVRPGERAERRAPGLGDVLVPKRDGLAGVGVVPPHLFGRSFHREGTTTTPRRRHPPLVGPINCRYLARVVRPRGIPRRGGRRGVPIPPRASTALQHSQRERIVAGIPVLRVHAERVPQSGGRQLRQIAEVRYDPSRRTTPDDRRGRRLRRTHRPPSAILLGRRFFAIIALPRTMRRQERRRGEKEEEEGGRRDDDDDDGGRRTRDRGARAAVRTAPPTTYPPGGLLAAVVVWSVRCCRFRRRFLTANDDILALSSRLHLWGDATDFFRIVDEASSKVTYRR